MERIKIYTHNILDVKPLRKLSLGKYNLWCEDNIKVDIKIIYDDVYGVINLAQDMVQLVSVLNTVKKF
jgi:hypothetical protein